MRLRTSVLFKCGELVCDCRLKLVVPSEGDLDSVTGEPLGRIAMVLRTIADSEYVTARLVRLSL